MTRKQAIISLWHDSLELMGYKLGDDNTLFASDLQPLWTLCFTNAQQSIWYRSLVAIMVDMVKNARALGDKLNCGDKDTALELLMCEIEEFARRFPTL